GSIDHPYKAELDRLARGVNVRMMGSFKQDDIPAIFSEIDVLIVPSIWYENCPTVIREAFANRTPVVVSNIGGMAEAVRDGVDGLHFQVNDAADLACKLRRFLDEPALIETFRQNIQMPPTAAAFANEIEKIYHLVTQKQPRIHL
ncbi:MAG: glycosyltransferase, partial [Anaerolineae bacterium]|nr:glycosyltransferase [Anaerolineae bacterium]